LQQCAVYYDANADAATAEEELNEEDQQLKGELDMMVERLTVCTELNLFTCKAHADHC
jgi:hypothetical protein